MIANHIHDALAQVRKLQDLIIAKRLFRGYSGNARIGSGVAALVAAMVLGSGRVPRDPLVHLWGWGLVLATGLVLNYGALVYWFLFDREVRRNPRMLKPAADALPALAVGAVLTLRILDGGDYGQFNLLFGVWMTLYGLAQVAYRQSLPSGIYLVGLGYIACGALSLLWFKTEFLNPWPMGIVFFMGELIGGVVLVANKVTIDSVAAGRFGELAEVSNNDE